MTLPDVFLPLKSDEMVIRLHGGARLIEGVQIVAHYTPTPALSLGSKYLMFILPDSAGEV